MKTWESLLETALKSLFQAVKALEKPTQPDAPMPRPRVYEICKGVYWPYVRTLDISNGAYVRWDAMDVSAVSIPEDGEWPMNGNVGIKDLTVLIAGQCGHQPRRIFKVLRCLEEAAAWCHARAAGRRRHAEEILRQQAAAVEALNAKAALRMLEW